MLADFGLSKSFGYRGDPIPVKIPADYIEGKGTPPEYAGRGFGSYRKDGDKWNLTWDRAFSFVGTQEYLAPEVIRRNHYTYAIDWWALGCIVCECLTGRVPFRGRDDESNAELYERVLVADWDAMYRGDHPRTYLKERYRIDSTTYDFIDGLLAKEPMFRLTEPCVKTHPYFTNVDWDTVEKGDYQDPSQLEIDPVAEYNTQFFPRLCLEETPTVDMSGHDYGKEPDDTKTALNSDEIYAKAQEQFREELKSFEWNCLWDEYESEYGEEEGEGEEAEEVEEVREEEVAEVAEAAEVREEENTADVHEDIHVDEAGDIEMEQEETETLAEELKPPSVRSAPSIRAPSVKSTKTASLRAPSIKTPSIKAPSVVLGSPRSPRSSVAPSLPQSDIPPVSPSDLGITTANVDNTTPRLPSGPPQSGLSVSDVISVPLRDSDSPNLIIRRHRPPTTADRFQNRLSVEINGIIGQLGDEDWEQLDMEADEIPEAVNGANESGQSSFLRGFLGRRQGGRLVSMRQRSTSTRPSSALRKAVTSESDEASRKKPQLSRGFESTKRALTRMAFPPSKRVGSNGSTYLWSNSPSPVASLRGTYASPVHPSGSASLRASVDDVAARSWASTLSPNGKRTARPDLSTPGFFSRSKRRGKLDVNAGSSGSGSASASTTTLESTPPATVTTTTTDGVPRLEVKASEPIVWDLPLSTSPTKR